MRSLLLVLALVLLAPMAGAATNWSVLPDPAWSGDGTVNVIYYFTETNQSNPKIGTDTTITGPLLTSTPKLISADPFAGSGRVICLVAYAQRGTVKSVVVSSCPPAFPLGPPVLLQP